MLQLVYNAHCKTSVNRGGDYTVKEHKKLQHQCIVTMWDTVFLQWLTVTCIVNLQCATVKHTVILQ